MVCGWLSAWELEGLLALGVESLKDWGLCGIRGFRAWGLKGLLACGFEGFWGWAKRVWGLVGLKGFRAWGLMKQNLKYWCSSSCPSSALPGGALQCRPSIISCLFSSRQSFMNIIIYPMTSSYVDHPSPIPYCILIRVASSVLENKWKWILKYEQPKMNVSALLYKYWFVNVIYLLRFCILSKFFWNIWWMFCNVILHILIFKYWSDH